MKLLEMNRIDIHRYRQRPKKIVDPSIVLVGVFLLYIFS